MYNVRANRLGSGGKWREENKWKGFREQGQGRVGA